MVEGSIWRSLVDFAVPIFLGNLFQQLYNTADTLIVGNFIGKEALAAVSSSGSLINMMVGFLSGLTTGAGVLIAKYYGAKEYDKMSRAIHTGLAAAALAGLATVAKPNAEIVLLALLICALLHGWANRDVKIVLLAALSFAIGKGAFAAVAACLLLHI